MNTRRKVFVPLECKESVVVSRCRVPLSKWMSSWKVSGDAHFLRVSCFCQHLRWFQTISIFSHMVMETSVILWSNDHFGPEWNILTDAIWIAMKWVTACQNIVLPTDLTCYWLCFSVSVAVDAAVELITGRQPDAGGEGNGSMENHAVAKSLKRPNADSDEEDDKGAVAPPIHDIYRARQQKRIR